MFSIRGLAQKTWDARQLHIKVLLVLLSFTIMVLSSIIIMNRTLNDKLLQHADETIDDIQWNISRMMYGQEAPLNFIADHIEDMVRRGEGLDAVKDYMARCSSQEFKDRMRIPGYYSVYGYFIGDDEYYDGGGWVPNGGFIPQQRPWYSAAIESKGGIAVSEPYVDADSHTLVVAYARLIYGDGGEPFGVVCLDVPLDYIKELIINRHITESSYGFVVDQNLYVIIHPSEDIVGEKMGESNNDVKKLTDYVSEGLDMSLNMIISYNGIKSLLFGRLIDNGWYLCIVVPEAEYYKELHEMTWVISWLGALMAAALCLLLIRIDAAKHRADEESRQKSSFLAVMSHEIRTPMNAIMGITEIQLQEQGETLSKDVKEAFDKIYYSGSLMLQLINDLLDLSKIEVGKLEIVHDRYETASMINEIVHLNKIRYDSKPIEFKLNVDENLPASLVGDVLRIKQVLSNLLSNAFKYTWRGEVELSISTEAGKDGGGPILVLGVRDTGQGISPEDIGKLFEEYTRFNSRANRTTAGSGLGLNITRNLVRLMEGEISVESELEKGSLFTVRLPQGISGNAVLGKELVDNLSRFQFSSVSQLSMSPILREHMPYGSVLIVDDIETNIFVAKLLIQPYGIKIDTAASGEEAIDRVKNGGVYDVIFMDHMMPKMDGIEATGIIRGMGYKKPIVALTADAVEGQADIYMSSGFDDFISKPIDIRMLNTVLNKYVRKKHPLRVTEAARMAKTDPSARLKKTGGTSDRKNRLTELPGLDYIGGLELFDGEEEDYILALRSFAQSAPGVLDRLRTVTEENLIQYATDVHGFKSMSAWVCATGISDRAAGLEAMAKKGELSGVLEHSEDFIKDASEFAVVLLSRLDEAGI